MIFGTDETILRGTELQVTEEGTGGAGGNFAHTKFQHVRPAFSAEAADFGEEWLFLAFFRLVSFGHCIRGNDAQS